MQFETDSSRVLERDLVTLELSPTILELVKKEVIQEYHLMPIQLEKNVLVLATSKLVDNSKIIGVLENLIGRSILLVKVTKENLENAVSHYYGVTLFYKNMSFSIKSFEEIEKEQSSATELSRETTAPIVQKINSIINDAIRMKASDIHIEPMDNSSTVYLRIHGDLQDFSSSYPISKSEKTAVVNVIKNMCKPGLDITLKQVEQKGQFIIQEENRLIDCRVSVIPTIRQEKVVIRLLDPSKIVVSLEDLGYELADLIRYRKRLTRTSGLILFVAPTGHGKTTSLYASLMYCDPKEKKINAVEDPPEYRVEGITQIAVRPNEKKELNFSYLAAIKALLRQDPDIILVGETRSHEEAEAVLEASKTGHLMFTTLHARDSTQAIPRLFDMGIDRRSLLSEMICVVSQRLVRVNCPNCSVPYMPSDRALLYLTAKEIETVIEKGHPKRSKGCPECYKTGRRAIAEFLYFDNETRDFLSRDRDIRETLSFLKEKKGFRSMWEKGLEMVKEGDITLESLVKVLDRNEDDDEELRAYQQAR